MFLFSLFNLRKFILDRFTLTNDWFVQQKYCNTAFGPFWVLLVCAVFTAYPHAYIVILRFYNLHIKIADRLYDILLEQQLCPFLFPCFDNFKKIVIIFSLITYIKTVILMARLETFGFLIRDKDDFTASIKNTPDWKLNPSHIIPDNLYIFLQLSNQRLSKYPLLFYFVLN